MLSLGRSLSHKSPRRKMIIGSRIACPRIFSAKLHLRLQRAPLQQSLGKRHISIFHNVADLLVNVHDSSGLPWLILVPVSKAHTRTSSHQKLLQPCCLLASQHRRVFTYLPAQMEHQNHFIICFKS